ncbi:LOW QUALITY PROTEIN: anaphase-promoting complex subunit 1-like [Uloborus diversus]|uniref:LOW QUALITY PROTEIN: anaphase-promoting complex subunit 1-like n=1 Tax=Uloborus diversus TaxID=327109 RepID=UPI002409AB13|nr:LOW QUALITY PROTEIN: anaphase-promoting complex subunit 1-like [Uloborus diversus]
MITAGEPQEFIPLGRDHLKIHPGDVHLPTQHVPTTPAASSQNLTRDLLKALRGVSLKDQSKEQWFLRGNPDDDGEEEFYYNGKTVVWSKGNGHGVRKVHKSFTVENIIQQVLWTEFRIRSCKPRITDAVIEMEDPEHEVLSGVCILEGSTLSVFSKSGEDFIVSTPFQVLRAWSSKHGIIFERNTTPDGNFNQSKLSKPDNLPVIFSMMHPLDDIAPVIGRNIVSGSVKQISYFCDPSDEIVFCTPSPSLIMTYNKAGYHSVWRVRTTTFQEAEYACTKLEMDSTNHTRTPVTKESSLLSRYNVSHTPTMTISTPFHSYPSSRTASPSVIQSRSSNTSASSLTHMATLSRSHPPSLNSSITHPQSFTPHRALNFQIPASPGSCSGVCKFMEPLAPDICFDHEWSESKSSSHSEKASKAFLSMDITGHNFLCYFLKQQQSLQLVKFEETNDDSQWIFGTISYIPALDAEPIPDLNLILTVDANYTLSLYTGLTKISKVHVADIFGPNCDVPPSQNYIPPTCFATPRRNSLVSSTRPPSAASTRFGDEVQMLSPVPFVAENPSSKTVLSDELSFLHVGPVRSVRDAVKNRVTLETSVGYYRLQIPEVATSKIVLKCLQALKHVLPRDIYTQVFVKWYSQRNAPGPCDMNSELELNSFLMCLLNTIGFDVEGIVLGSFMKENTAAPQVKKQKTHEGGCDDDWSHVLSSNLHRQMLDLKLISSSCSNGSVTSDNSPSFNVSAVLFPYIAHLLFALHLVYEDCKLDVLLWNDLAQLCSFLCELARELREYKFLDLYWKDFPNLFCSLSKKPALPEEQVDKIHYPSYFVRVPSIYKWTKDCLSTGICSPFPCIPQVTTMICNIVLAYAILAANEKPVLNIQNYLIQIIPPGIRMQEIINCSLLSSCYAINSNPKKVAVYFLSRIGFTPKDLDSLPIGIALPIKDAILHCWHQPSGLWTKNTFELIGRHDLSALQLSSKKGNFNLPRRIKSGEVKNGASKEDEALSHLDFEELRLRFGQDHRINDVYEMLQSSKPARIALVQRPEVSDHEFIEEQERHLYNLCIRTMAATVGRGMFTLRTHSPVVTETLPIPKLCLTGRAPPRNTTVDLSHIDVPANMNMWPLFHNGVAEGLSISPNASKIDSTWIVYNKPRSSSNDTPTEHAGFLMALGLNGHLTRLSTLSIHDYLCKGHELTSVGIILGVSASKRGTMDLSATKMLSIHIEALLPPTSTELDVAPAVQVASVMGLGLLYQGSGHHHMAEVLLGEIGRPPGPEMEHCIDRESYSLAAGLALGLITLGKGKEMSGIADLPMADQLYHYMVGGHKRPLTGIHKEKHKSPSYQIREGDNVNVDVTSPGATLALGLMFFDTDNQAIAEWMRVPDTQFLLDMVRPDFLLLRVLSKGLILWSSIHPSTRWIEDHLPHIVAKYAFQRGSGNSDVDYETMSQAYCNIIAGCCFCIGLKFAGSANNEAFEILMQYTKHFLTISRKSIGDQAGRSTMETCLNVVVLSLAMVMAGTGDLEVIRICRHLRSRIGQASSYVLYGSHMVTHMALGLLFLGGGRYSLSTSPLSIGALVCAFFPKFPQHSNDNRYHLQAFYHLYVLAIEPRVIIPRLLGANKPVYINIKVVFKDTPDYKDAEYTVKAPCLLPELKFLKKVIVEDSRYWPIVFDCNENWETLRNLLENGGTLHVMQNAGCLPYSEDPQGFRSLLAQTCIWNAVHAWNIKNAQLSTFSSDPVALNFASCFLGSTSNSEKEKEWQQKICGYLFECASLEKMEALPICVSMIQIIKQTDLKSRTYELWQIKMVSAYEKWIKRYSAEYNDSLTLLRHEFSTPILFEIQKTAEKACKGFKDHLFHYISTNWKSEIWEYPPDIAAFLLLYDIDGIENWTLQCNSSDINFPYLFSELGRSMSVSSVRSIMSILMS